MKKLTLCSLLLLLAASSHAQFSKGDKYLGGNFQFKINDWNVSDNDEADQIEINISPSFLRFKTDRKATGFRLVAGYQSTEQSTASGNLKFNGWSLGAGIFAQRYMLLGKGFYLAGEYGANLSTFLGQSEYILPDPSTTDHNNYSLRLYLTPQIGYKLSERLLIGLNFANVVALDLVHYRLRTTNSSGTNLYKNTAFNFSSSVNNTTVGSLGISFAWKIK